MFVTLWEFEVKPGSKELFERTYGRDGQWAELFRRHAGYLGTRLLQEVGAAGVYVTVDTWESREAYEGSGKSLRPSMSSWTGNVRK